MVDIIHGLLHAFVLNVDAPRGRCGNMPSTPNSLLGEELLSLQGVWRAGSPAVSIFEVSLSCGAPSAWKSGPFRGSLYLVTMPGEWLGVGGHKGPAIPVHCWMTLMGKTSHRAPHPCTPRWAEAFSGLFLALSSPSTPSCFFSLLIIGFDS